MSRVASLLGGRSVGIAIVACVAPWVAAVAAVQGAGASAPPSLNVSPPGNYHDGETISVGVGPNGYFTPNARINIIECADPGGLGVQSAQGHHDVRREHHSGKHDPGWWQRGLLPVGVPRVPVAQLLAG